MKSIKCRKVILFFSIVMVIGLSTFILINYILSLTVDRGVLEGYPCKPPCWEGIVPGTTSPDEAVEIIHRLPYVLQSSIIVEGTSEIGGVRWENVFFHYGRIQPGINWYDNVVQEIKLGVSRTTVEDIISIYGTPEAILVGTDGIPEKYCYLVNLLYRSQGLRFLAYTEYDNTYFGPETIVGVAIFNEPGTLDEFLVQMFGELSPDVVEYLSPWNGYGDVYELYKPRNIYK